MINKETFFRAQALVNDWQGKENQRVPAEVIREIFNTHNEIYPDNPEYSVGCGGCRERVWSKVKNWYHENKQQFGF